MSKPRENKNCPYCLSPIGKNDEIIRCPECGVIHHAECWKTNGKCSVYGCDGFQAWNNQISEKIAPKLGTKIDIDASTAKSTEVRCMECGQPVKPGQLTCWECRRKQNFGFFENCTGPSVVILCGLVGIITLIVKALT